MLRQRRSSRRGKKAADEQYTPLDTTEWEIDFSDIQFCKTLDGKDVELGHGTFGRVLKAVKGGVQVIPEG